MILDRNKNVSLPNLLKKNKAVHWPASVSRSGTSSCSASRSAFLSFSSGRRSRCGAVGRNKSESWCSSPSGRPGSSHCGPARSSCQGGTRWGRTVRSGGTTRRSRSWQTCWAGRRWRTERPPASASSAGVRWCCWPPRRARWRRRRRTAEWRGCTRSTRSPGEQRDRRGAELREDSVSLLPHLLWMNHSSHCKMYSDTHRFKCLKYIYACLMYREKKMSKVLVWRSGAMLATIRLSRSKIGIFLFSLSREIGDYSPHEE